MSLISTFESQCRALTSAPSPDENASRFIVGTQSPSSTNLLYLFEYRDDNNSLAKISFKFPYGELWHLNTSNKHQYLLAAVTSHHGRSKASLFRLPSALGNPIEDDYELSEAPIEKAFDLSTNSRDLTQQCHWHPDDGDHLLICGDCNLEFWDINAQERSQEFSISNAIDKSSYHDSFATGRPRVTDLRWSSLFNCSVVAAAVGPTVYGIDIRIPHSSPSSICWRIEDQRCNKVRSVDFNPNSQYYLASGGDDSRANFWDLRNTASPQVRLQAHTHWIWALRYNPFHDQLVLSAGSDARVALMRLYSIASEPFGTIAEFEEEMAEDSTPIKATETLGAVDIEGEFGDRESATRTDELVDIKRDEQPERLKDEVINVYEEHDDSVYSVEWATDPWIFASLGFESRLIINKVPKDEKFNILF